MTAFTLKIIALSVMLIDHMGAAFPDCFPVWFRIVGRLAYPIFIYLLAEGFRYTKARDKFLMRLLAFALISEIPYDLALGYGINILTKTNIFYTLFLGGTALCLYERMKERRNRQTMAVIFSILPTAILAEILTADYGGMGVLFIFAVYAVKPKIPRLITMGAFSLSQFIPLAVTHNMGIAIPMEYLLMIPFALATVPIIAFYNGRRGLNKSKMAVLHSLPCAFSCAGCYRCNFKRRSVGLAVFTVIKF
jgi:hypothetical protein